MNKLIRHCAVIVFCSVAYLMLVSCSDDDNNSSHLDHADTYLPFPAPKIEPLLQLQEAPELPTTVKQTLELQRAFFSNDFQKLEQTLTKQHHDYLSGQQNNNVTKRFINNIQGTQLAGIDACQHWLKTMPTSYIAHWVCGAMWQSGAHAARSRKSANKVSAAQLSLMHERLVRSNELFEKALNLDSKPVEVLTMLAANYYLAGNPARAEEHLLRAEQIFSHYLPIYQTRLSYMTPEWGGGPETLLIAFDRAKQAGLSKEELTDLEEQYIIRPNRMTTPGSARAYWEAKIAIQATSPRLSGLLDDYIWTKSWLQALSIADQLIASSPEDETAFYRRAKIKAALGQMDEARQDYLFAAAMGYNNALQELILANIRGGLGITQQSLEIATNYCRYGAPLGLSAAANCVGSMFFEGGAPGIPFQHDIPQSLAWHLLGARAGHFNSQYDLGWLLFSGKVNGVEAEIAKKTGIFWLQRAAEQGHQFASRKLDEHNVAPNKTDMLSGIMNYVTGEWKKLLE